MNSMARIIMRIVALSAEVGSRHIIFSAIGKDENGKDEGLRGQYTSLSKVKEPSDFVLSAVGVSAEERLWVSGNNYCRD